MINYLKIEVRKLVKSEFARNAFTVFSGVSIAQFIPILISPILTRIYSPSDFAILGLFTSTAMLFTNIASFGYEQAIMLPKKKDDAINIFALSVIGVLGITLLSLAIMVFLNSPITGLLKNKEMSFWLYLVPISVFLGGILKILNMWAARQKKFKRLAMRNITQTSTTGGTKLLMGFLKFTNSGLVVGTLAGQTISTGLMAWQTQKDKIDYKSISKTKIKHNAIAYKDFPLFTNWQSFLDMFNETGTKYIISNLSGAFVLGSYIFSWSLIRRPINIIGESLSQVFYQKASESYNQGKNLQLYLGKLVIRLFFLGLPIFLPLIIFGPQLFSFIFGNDWYEAGKYAQILAPWLYIKFIGSANSTLPLILKKQKEFFMITVVKNVVTPVLFFGLLRMGFIFTDVLTYVVIFNSIISIGILFWLFKISKITNYQKYN